MSCYECRGDFDGGGGGAVPVIFVRAGFRGLVHSLRKVAQLDLERLNDELTESIRQLKATEQALQASESHYRLLAENTKDVIWEMDLNGHLSYVSPSVERLNRTAW
jgi:PAS domain-containing protein